MDFQQPYTTEEIEKRPLPVLVSVLIGLLLITTFGWISAVNNNSDLRDKVDADKQKRIDMYDKIYYLEAENANLKGSQEQTDSTLRARTGPYVNRILRRP